MGNYEILFSSFKKITDIPSDHYPIIKEIFYYKTLKKGEFYCKEGEYTTTVSFLLNGIVKGYYLTTNGEEHIKAFGKKGQFITSYRSLILKEPSNFNIQAVTDCSLLTVKYSTFNKLMEEYLCWQKFARIIGQSEFIKKDKREYQLLTMSLKDRYQEFLNEFGDIKHLIPQYQVASYLGVKAPSLSRMIRNNKE